MFDKQAAIQYTNFIKQAGYQYSKDTLGFYFDNGMKRFSIMKTGPIFQCFYNERMNGNWALRQKSNNILDYVECLRWILTNIQKG